MALKSVGGKKGNTIKTASVKDAEDLAREWSDEVLACRSGLMRHNFEPYIAQHNKKLKYIYVILRCPRCTAQKHYEITERGTVLGKSWFTYPPGYLAKGKGRILGDASDAVRREALARLFNVAVLTTKEAKEDTPRPSTLEVLQGGK